MQNNLANKKLYGFPKSDRLCSKISIDQVFASGKNVFAYPIKAIFYFTEPTHGEASCQAMFVVPKRKFKRAVSRNAIRRKMREAYRLNKQILTSWCLDNNIELKLALLYVASDALNFDQIQGSIVKIMKQLTEKEIKQ